MTLEDLKTLAQKVRAIEEDAECAYNGLRSLSYAMSYRNDESDEFYALAKFGAPAMAAAKALKEAMVPMTDWRKDPIGASRRWKQSLQSGSDEN